MNVEIYKIISTVGFILAALMLILSIILFLKFNIPKIFGDITGTTAKKAIQDIREQNSQSGNGAYNSSPVKVKKGKPMDKIPSSEKLMPANSRTIGVNIGNEKDTTQKLKDQNQTTVLFSNSDDTTVLNITESLTGETNMNTLGENNNQQANLELDITFLHTDEVIL